MIMLIQPSYVDIELVSYDSVRLRSGDSQPDIKDCLGIADAQFRTIQQHHRAWREGRLVIHDPSAIAGPGYQQFNPRFGGIAASRGSTTGNVQAQSPGRPASSAMPSGGMSGPVTFEAIAGFLREAVGAVQDCAQVTRDCAMTVRDGGTPGPGSCETPVHCGATPLGFNTFESADYPLAGVAVGTIEVGANIQITSGRADVYTPLWLFLSSRDTANGFAEVPGYLTSESVNENSQLSGDNLTNRPLDSTLYNNVGPLMLDNWHEFTNVAPKVLLMGFGHALGPAAEVAFSGAFFGQAKRFGS
jgi:hypothetical protein